MTPDQFKDRVIEIAQLYPIGMGGVVQILGPVPVPPEDMDEDQVRQLLTDLEDVAAKIEARLT